MEQGPHSARELADLVRAAQRGDRAAQERLFRAHAPLALRCALGMCQGQMAEAEDLVQDVMVTCLTHLSDLREPEHFVAWLLRCLRNRAINRGATARSRERALQRLADGDTADGDPLERLIRAQRRLLLRQAFDRLEEGPIKQAAQLYYFDEIDSVAEVASRLGTNKSTVTTRLDRFRQLLKKRIARAIVVRQCSADASADASEVV
ncbi:MAG: sigma-70 family RNA polymerase sigma factor [Deltaproteobacteria bacterium]|nr:sigma-70 family RNA polymerase sigma factor [Deltaproteobacteria bacterium]